MIKLTRTTDNCSVYDDTETESLLDDIQTLISHRTPFEISFSTACSLSDFQIRSLYKSWHEESATGDHSWRSHLTDEEASMVNYWDEAAAEASALLAQTEENLRRMMNGAS